MSGYETDTDKTQVIEVRLPKGQWKNDNGSHGSWKAHWVLMRDLKRRGYTMARIWRNGHKGMSFGHCRLDVYVDYPPRGRARADPSNADNIGKPIIDGFTQAGLWPDDDWKHVQGPFYRMGPKTEEQGWHTLEFHITPLEPETES